MNERIQLTDTPQSAIEKLSDGNPGALSVLCQLFKEGAEMDPDAAFGGLAHLLSLDSLNIYGADIWMLYKDVCGQRLVNVVTVLRARQLGLLAESTLKNAIQNHGAGVDVADLFKKVSERLPIFAKANALEAAEISS